MAIPETREFRELGVDSEALLLARLRKLAEIVVAVDRARGTGADRLALDGAIEGACNGAAIEIARICGTEPSFVNIKPIGGTQMPMVLPPPTDSKLE